ncbi:hypothetical protein [Abyssisolibacter fermentans]|uniref:hypothetical protein n=1 Tax=Abyssisolibacter fermentans TaxID=1766203 RepID=UPI00082F5F7A|nr:hypothetical protein [Abyssisolibacter fermentans]
MINWDIIIGILIVTALLIFLKYIVPYLKMNKMDFYREIKLGLMIFGYTFKDEKIKAIADMTYEVVNDLQILSDTPIEKQNEAVRQLSGKIMDEFGVGIEPKALDLIVQIAVTLLPTKNPIERI